MGGTQLTGIILDADYSNVASRGMIRLTFKSGGKIYFLTDPNFRPYFYLLPSNEKLEPQILKELKVVSEYNEEIRATSIEEETRLVRGKERRVFKVFLDKPGFVPKMSKAFGEFGTCFENDILFWKRYLIDKQISPLAPVKVGFHEEEGRFVVDSIENTAGNAKEELTGICFDIETYNPLGAPRLDKDPVIMISYSCKGEEHVLTTKKIERPFIKYFETEKEMIGEFVKVIKRLDPDIVVGYNSSNFDLPYLMERAAVNKIAFEIARYEGEEVKKEHHGLVDAVRIPGRINFDAYNVAKFVSVVGASEKVIKVNNFKLYEVYKAITGKEKIMVEKGEIWQQWDRGGEDLDRLAEYSLGDSQSLRELYEFFLPLEVEVATVAGTVLGEACVSTTSQLVEFMLMRYAQKFREMIPNKPNDGMIQERMANPYEGAYVKTPEAGIYENIVVFDFKGLYPSIIIAHNIDPATICTDCTDYFESPDGIKFRKDRTGIMPMLLKLLIDERSEVKKLYKKDPDNKSLGARSTSLKIIANAFYGYLGYARSRWYSRECASAVTAYARFFITEAIAKADTEGYKVLYGDSVAGDSIVRVRGKGIGAGYMKIEELFPNKERREGKEYHYLKGLDVETVDIDGKVAFKKINYVMRHRSSKRMYRVWMTNVQYIDVTEDHSLIGFANLAKMPGRTALDRLVEVRPTEFGKKIKSVAIKKVSAPEGKITRNYDSKLYELMGFFIGDGSFHRGHYKGKPSKNYYLGIAAGNDEKEILGGLLEPLRKRGTIRHIVNRGRGDLLINGLWMVRLFEEEILKEGHKRIPDFIFNEKRENICAFLRGLFSSDGTIMMRNGKPIIRYTTIDEELAQQIRLLLWEVGISSSVFKENVQNSYDGVPSGTFSRHVNVKEKEIFARDVRFLIRRKNRILAKYRETGMQKRKIRDLDFDISHIKKVEEIENRGYVYDLEVEGAHRFFANGVLVHNTDSIFLIRGEKTKDDSNLFLNAINSSLPAGMELELEDFYTRGVFVGKRGGEGTAGAKKKYALMSESGRIKIKGFELVRRDWAKISRDTQLAVLEAILKEGSKEKAVNIVKEVVERLRSGTVDIKELIMNTQLRKGIGSYDIKSPELAAAKKAVEKGVRRKEDLVGASIGYVITKHGSSISEKAEVWELATDYDADYYIEHQIIPATLKILKELGYNAEELRNKGSQKKL